MARRRIFASLMVVLATLAAPGAQASACTWSGETYDFGQGQLVTIGGMGSEAPVPVGVFAIETVRFVDPTAGHVSATVEATVRVWGELPANLEPYATSAWGPGPFMQTRMYELQGCSHPGGERLGAIRYVATNGDGVELHVSAPSPGIEARLTQHFGPQVEVERDLAAEEQLLAAIEDERRGESWVRRWRSPIAIALLGLVAIESGRRHIYRRMNWRS